jgi:hypothetical protein
MKTIHLTKKEAEKIAKNLGVKGKPPKKIVFHEEFDKGMRLYVCLHCGYPGMFMGVPIQMCYCKKPRKKIYNLDQLDEFILKLQRIHNRVYKNGGSRMGKG